MTAMRISGAVHYRDGVREQRVEIGDIPARLYVPSGSSGLLLLGHGGGQSKDSPRFVRLARQCAEATGLAVVCIDAIAHGDRNDVPTAAPAPGIPRGWHSSVSARMVQDWQAVAEALGSIGPAQAYVGVSMGAIFGVPTVAAISSIKAAVFVVGGVPAGGGIDDPPLGPLLEAAATRLEHADVLMLNMTQDDIFPIRNVHVVFDAVRGRSKRLMFWEGGHDDWPDELIAESMTFLHRHLA